MSPICSGGIWYLLPFGGLYKIANQHGLLVSILTIFNDVWMLGGRLLISISVCFISFLNAIRTPPCADISLTALRSALKML